MARKTTDPGERAGVYKHIDDVPDRYRLYHHSAAYNGRNVWEEFLSEFYFEHFGTDYLADILFDGFVFSIEQSPILSRLKKTAN